MSGFFTMLGSAARALDAQRYALDVTGQNIGNVNTPGYTRRRALLSEVAPIDAHTPGSGVRVDGVTAERNRFLDYRLRAELPAKQRDAALAETLATIELFIVGDGSSLNQRLSSFFDAAARLADAPTSSTARQEMVLRGRGLATDFNDLSASFSAVQRESDLQIRAGVLDINALATEIADLNATLGQLDRQGPQALHLRDLARQAVEKLADLTSIEAIERPDGGFDVAVGAGRPLVVGHRAHPLSVAPRPGTGFVDVLSADGTPITTQIPGGRIAGLLQARDGAIPSYLAALDELAYEVVGQVNAIHTAGFDSTGNPGVPFFQPLASSTNAAGQIAVNPALLATGGEALVAASNDALAPGDNGAARALAALRDTRILAGGTATFADAWAGLTYSVGRDSQAAQAAHRARGELVRQVESMREGSSGVSMDEEAANLMRFQRAYEANARYFRTIDETLLALMQLIRI